MIIPLSMPIETVKKYKKEQDKTSDSGGGGGVIVVVAAVGDPRRMRDITRPVKVKDIDSVTDVMDQIEYGYEAYSPIRS